MLHAVNKGGGMMTREEAISYGNNYYIELISACCKISEKHKDFVKMSLEALEQEPILDKIRAEITNIPITDTDGRNNNWYREPQAIINDVLHIIDKYKAESEGK